MLTENYCRIITLRKLETAKQGSEIASKQLVPRKRPMQKGRVAGNDQGDRLFVWTEGWVIT